MSAHWTIYDNFKGEGLANQYGSREEAIEVGRKALPGWGTGRYTLTEWRRDGEAIASRDCSAYAGLEPAAASAAALEHPYIPSIQAALEEQAEIIAELREEIVQLRPLSARIEAVSRVAHEARNATQTIRAEQRGLSPQSEGEFQFHVLESKIASLTSEVERLRGKTDGTSDRVQKLEETLFPGGSVGSVGHHELPTIRARISDIEKFLEAHKAESDAASAKEIAKEARLQAGDAKKAAFDLKNAFEALPGRERQDYDRLGMLVSVLSDKHERHEAALEEHRKMVADLLSKRDVDECYEESVSAKSFLDESKPFDPGELAWVFGGSSAKMCEPASSVSTEPGRGPEWLPTSAAALMKKNVERVEGIEREARQRELDRGMVYIVRWFQNGECGSSSPDAFLDGREAQARADEMNRATECPAGRYRVTGYHLPAPAREEEKLEKAWVVCDETTERNIVAICDSEAHARKLAARSNDIQYNMERSEYLKIKAWPVEVEADDNDA